VIYKGLLMGFLCVFLCFTYLQLASLFILSIGVFSPVCFELSVPVQVLVCKNSSLK